MKKICLLILSLLIICIGNIKAETNHKKYVYKYYEAEDGIPKPPIGCIRKTGFTEFMGKPSGDKVVIQMSSLKYPLCGLPSGKYNIWIKQLNWKTPAKTRSLMATVNNAKIGESSFLPQQSYWLRWCKIGTFQHQQSVNVFLKISKSKEKISAPYFDVLLVTNDLKYIPEAADQNFQSFEKINSGIEFGEVTIVSGKPNTSTMEVIINSPAIKENLLLELRFLKNNPNGPGEKLTIVSHKINIKKGINKLSIPVKLQEGKYSLNTRLISCDKKIVYSLKTFNITIKASLVCDLGNYYFLTNDKENIITIHINSKALQEKTKKIEFKIMAANKVVLTENHSVDAAKIIFKHNIQKLKSGVYKCRITLFDKDNNVMIKKDWEITKSNLSERYNKLPPITTVHLEANKMLVNNKNFVPRKISHARGNSKIKRQGYNSISCWGTPKHLKAHLDAAWKHNLYGYAVLYDPYFYDKKNKKYNLSRIVKCVKELKGHPALLLWVISDEPDHKKIPAEILKEVRKTIEQVDPAHPSAINYCPSGVFQNYAGCSDISAFNIYPVPTKPISQVAFYLDRLTNSIKNERKRFIEIYLQTYAFPGWRMPTPEEYRAMFYLAVNHGAKAFSDFCYNDDVPGMSLKNDACLWSYMRIINQETIILEDVISQGNHYPINTNSAIDIALHKFAKKTYLIAVNTSSSIQKTSLTLPFAYATELFNNDKKMLKEQVLEITFKPFEVFVYLLYK